MLQWSLLLEIKPDIDVSAWNEYAFRFACLNGHLQVAQWLLEIEPDIDVSAKNEFAFQHTCENGHLGVAQWLWEVSNQTIDISADNEFAFQCACSNGHLQIAQWLHKVKPYHYVLKINAHGMFTHCEIRNVKERNWLQKREILMAHNKKTLPGQKPVLFQQLPLEMNRVICSFL